jgi:hypothetical protein
MISGLGSLQREILNTLEDARYDRSGYRGFGGESVSPGFPDTWSRGHRWTLPGWVTVGRNTVRLGLNVYDLRASCSFLARRHDKLDGGTIKPSFAAGFSRAAATLIKRGLLSPVESTLPIADFDEDRTPQRGLIHKLQDRMYLLVEHRRDL